MKLQYPVGATWTTLDRRGHIGTVWLERREPYEMWLYSVENADGSGRKRDWAPNQRIALELCKLWLEKPQRFKRKK